MFSKVSLLLVLFTNFLSPKLSKPSSDFRIPLKYDIHGIDVSHHQNNIDWERVSTENNKVKISFCFIKATEGINLNDKKFNRNWEECKNVGITRGAYHFFIPSISPRSQAINYINSVKLLEGDFAPVLDFEQESETMSVAEIRKNAKAWLNYVERHYGVRPIIYTNGHMYNKYIKGHFKNYPLWIANYQTNNIFESIYHPQLKFWQYSERGRVKGINGHVDFNAFLGEEHELVELTV